MASSMIPGADSRLQVGNRPATGARRVFWERTEVLADARQVVVVVSRFGVQPHGVLKGSSGAAQITQVPQHMAWRHRRSVCAFCRRACGARRGWGCYQG